MTTTKTTMPDRDVPRWMWLWFPPLILFAQIGAKAVSEEFYRDTMRHETGLVELGTVLFLVIATIFGLRLFIDRERLPAKWMGAWMLMFTLGCVYFGGEEASWGQHYFGWGTPEALASVNAQQETNIHNIAGVFDQLPRTLLTIGVLLGGIAAPLVLRRRHGDWRPAEGKWGWLLPTVVCLPTAILSTVVGLPRRLAENFDLELPAVLDYPGGEFKEYFFGLFLMLYLLSLSRRAKAG